MQRKKCKWSSSLCMTVSFPHNVICYWVSIVLSFEDPRKKEFFKCDRNCGFHDLIFITATFSSIPLHHFSLAKYLTSCLCFFIFSIKTMLQSSATTHFEDNFKHFNNLKNMLNIISVSRHKMGSFEIFISTLIGSFWGDVHHQLWVPKNHSHPNESSK